MLEAQDLQAIKEIMDASITANIAASEERMISRMDKRFDEVDKRFTKVDERLDKVDKRLDKVDIRFMEMYRRSHLAQNMILEQLDFVQIKLEEKIEEEIGKLRTETNRKILHFTNGMPH